MSDVKSKSQKLKVNLPKNIDRLIVGELQVLTNVG
jgi:hypothetical protein